MTRTVRQTKKQRRRKADKVKKRLPPKKSQSNDSNKKKTTKEKKDEKNTNILVIRKQEFVRPYQRIHDHFLNYDEMLQFLQNTKKQSKCIMELATIGSSGQGKPIYIALLTSPKKSVCPKFVTFICAGLKGDDAIAVSSALVIIQYLSRNDSVLKCLDYYIVPCANPDAYDKFIKSKVNNSNNKPQCPGTEKKPEKKKPVCEIDDPSDGSPNRDNSNSKVQCPGTEKNPETVRETDDPRDGSLKSKPKGENACPQSKQLEQARENKVKPQMDLSCNFPVVLGLSDMKNVATNVFLEKIKLWKESYNCSSPETTALLQTINNFQFQIKLVINLGEGGQTICYPYGFCGVQLADSKELLDLAVQAKCSIQKRTFQVGSIHDVCGLRYGHLIDFLKIDKSSIKFMYNIQVFQKTDQYDEAKELQNLMTYGCDVLLCIKRLAAGVFKHYMRVNKMIMETDCRTKPTDSF